MKMVHSGPIMSIQILKNIYIYIYIYIYITEMNLKVSPLSLDHGNTDIALPGSRIFTRIIINIWRKVKKLSKTFRNSIAHPQEIGLTVINEIKNSY